jgi:tubulin polyglutamylase TTLL4
MYIPVVKNNSVGGVAPQKFNTARDLLLSSSDSPAFVDSPRGSTISSSSSGSPREDMDDLDRDDDGDYVGEESVEHTGVEEEAEGEPHYFMDGDYDVDNDDDKDSVLSSGENESNIDEMRDYDLEDDEVRVVESIFVDRPPTIFFQYAKHVDEKRATNERTQVVKKTGKLLFKGGDVNCLRSAYKNNGFRKLISGKSWNVFWGKHLKPELLATLNPYQIANHFPSSWNLGRKDSLSRNIALSRRKHPKAYDFFSKTFILPNDITALRLELEAHPRSYWIIKPSASACGRGIRLMTAEALKEKKKLKNVIAQRYIHKPYLINGYKFDLRLYVVVTSFDPLRIYLYDNGLVRFCTHKYSLKTSHLKNRFRHLTNYSVNKKSDEYISNQSIDDDGEGHKWSLHAFEDYCKGQGINFEQVMENVKSIIIKSMISAEDPIASNTNRYVPHRGNIFELFGFDILLDHKLKPWVIEVNVSPSLSSGAPLDKKIKNMLMNDIYNLVGVKQCDISKHNKAEAKSAKAVMVKSRRPLSRKCSVFDLMNANGLSSISDDQADLLCTLEEEADRCGPHFERIFPSPRSGELYDKYFHSIRSNNILYSQWFKTPIEVKNKLLKYRTPLTGSSGATEREREKEREKERGESATPSSSAGRSASMSDKPTGGRRAPASS